MISLGKRWPRYGLPDTYSASHLPTSLNVTMPMRSFQTADGWIAQRPTTPEYYVEAHTKVAEALAVLLADPGKAPPAVIDVLVDSDVDTRYAELNVASATAAHVTIAIDYAIAQCVARGLLSRPLLDNH